MKAALGKIILTPPDFLGGYLGKPMAGYTPAPKITGKYDDIYAHAVLIEDIVIGNIKKRVLLVSTDYLKVPLLWTDYVREKIEERYGIHKNQIMVHAIHTHKSMDMSGEFAFGGGIQNLLKGIMVGAYHSDDKYKVWAAMQIVKLVGELIEKLRPVKIAWSSKKIDDPILVNRRHPLRKSKGDLNVISFRDNSTNELFGLVVSFGMHPTTLANFVDKMSADYPGRVLMKIEELSQKEFGKSIDCAFFTAPAGDINPITTISKDFEFLATQSQDYLLNQTGDIEHTKELGYFIGEEAYKFAKSIPDKDYYNEVDFRSYVKTFWVPMKDFTRYKSPHKLQQQLIYFVKRYILFPVALYLSEWEEPNFPGFAVKHNAIMSPKAAINVYSQVQYIRFHFYKKDNKEDAKEFSVCGIPGELFEDLGKDIKQLTFEKPQDTFIFQNANDWISYLFPLEEYTTTGGYEPFASFSPYSGIYVKFAFKRLLQDIKEKIIAGYY